eukprot:2945914-Rhodomonas_salina.4
MPVLIVADEYADVSTALRVLAYRHHSSYANSYARFTTSLCPCFAICRTDIQRLWAWAYAVFCTDGASGATTGERGSTNGGRLSHTRHLSLAPAPLRYRIMLRLCYEMPGAKLGHSDTQAV